MVWRGARLAGEMDWEEGGIAVRMLHVPQSAKWEDGRIVGSQAACGAVKWSVLIASMFAMASCAADTATRTVVPPSLPTSEEVAAYISAHWGEWAPRFAKFSAREGADATLVKVENVKCVYRYFMPECNFEVTGDFSPDDRRTSTLFSQFDRDSAGNLEEVFVLFEERKR